MFQNIFRGKTYTPNKRFITCELFRFQQEQNILKISTFYEVYTKCSSALFAFEIVIYKNYNLFIDGHLCPEDIPNGYENPRHGANRDYENGRGYTHAACDEGFRNHRTMIMECVGGTWLTGQERFGLDTSFMCLPETDENTWFIPDYFKEEYGN